MGLLRKKFSIPPNQIGYLYKRNRLFKKLNPGIYYYFDFRWELQVVILSSLSKIITVTNQEVLTNDNISLRLSYLLEYQITNSDLLTTRFDLFTRYPSLTERIETLIHSLSQVYLRDAIANVYSQEINQQRDKILDRVPESLQNELSEYGITVRQLIIKDILFPKLIQKLFAQELETKIRAKADLENARTAVAAARTLKNAAKLMENDGNIRFIQFLETITKIASQGNHTFHIGQFSENKLDEEVK